MSGNAPIPEPTGETPQFPAVGQYDWVPGPGEPGYTEPEPEVQDELVIDPEDDIFEDTDDLDDVDELDPGENA